MSQVPITSESELNAAQSAFRADYAAVRDQIGRVIVGHAPIIDGVVTCLFVGGHALLEGVPGLGKTALVRALSQAVSLRFTRIQFTPDLMPADVIGTNIIEEDEHGRRAFKFIEGPVFSQIVLADEINRATPKTQSAMLEAMQERQVTAGGAIRPLPAPFFVMATQNPLEQEGTYPLPEAQLDRFFFKLVVEYSNREELAEILERTATGHVPQVRPVIDGPTLLKHQALVRRVVIAPHVRDHLIRVTLATHPKGPFSTAKVNQYVRFGASPRAAQTIELAAKARALTEGRVHVSFDDIKAVALPALRHRVICSFEAEADGVSTDLIVADAIANTPTAV
jgi:MoxR-like ATPase